MARGHHRAAVARASRCRAARAGPQLCAGTHLAAQGRGKSGGVRAIYYWIKDRHQIYMLVVYPKSKKDDLSDKETAILRELVKEL